MKETEELVEAAFDGDMDRLRVLLDGCYDINKSGPYWNPLHAAIENERIATAKELLDRGADIEWINQGMTPLAHAVDIAIDGTTQAGKSGSLEPTAIIDLLLGRGASRQSGLEAADAYGNLRLRRHIEEYDNNANPQGSSREAGSYPLLDEPVE